MTLKALRVAVGVLQDAFGRVFLCRRPPGGHLAGLWEFPGGKLEPGETLEAGLARELSEELGIRVFASEPLIRLPYHYPDRSVVLEVHRILDYEGTPHGREGQPCGWHRIEDLVLDELPPADAPILAAIQLPPTYVITGEDPGQPEAFLARLDATLARGTRLVQLRAHGLDDPAYQTLASAALTCCRRYGARLLLNRDREAVRTVGADGQHLTHRRLWTLSERPLPRTLWVGASCHNAADLEKARSLGLDYALLSPVLPTASHPEASPLGWDDFARLVATAGLPVYALGGMTPEDIDIARHHGGQGIATLRAGWSNTPLTPTNLPALPEGAEERGDNY
ncbi:8-oxo-dGTP diphosphatase [Gammaproteobacteria bacterium]